MQTLGNLIWIVFGGLKMAVGYFCVSLLLMFTIIGIPFGLQTMKLGILCLWPFGHEVTTSGGQPSSLSTWMNLIWFLFGGFFIFIK